MNRKRFIKKIIGDGKLNLRKTFEENGRKGVILSYNKKNYERIKELLPELNEISTKLFIPFDISVEEENLEYGEVKFTYTVDPTKTSW